MKASNFIKMKSAYFIMQMWQTGNIGSHNIKKLDANPKEGYINYEEAKSAMLRLRKDGDWDLKQRGYSFSIMKLFWNDK